MRFASGNSDSKNSNVSASIKILGGEEITNRKAFLPGGFEAGIVAFALGTEFVNGFEVF